MWNGYLTADYLLKWMMVFTVYFKGINFSISGHSTTEELLFNVED
jgi:hypothetical protein